MRTRLLAARLSEALGQNVLVDNRAGGGGAIGGSLATKAPPDGYTLFLGGITTLATGPFIHKNLPFDPLKDFQTVTQATLQPLLLMVHPSLPVKNVKEYIALAKKRKGEINYATSGPAGSGHLGGELFNYITQAGVVHIPYKGAPPALQDLAAGQVQSMFGTMLAAVPVVRSGKIRAVAITGPKRSIALPDVVTFAEAGLPQFDSGEPDFGFVQLYARNRYSGADRVSDADHLALAFTSRLLHPKDGTLVWWEMSFTKDEDPCEVYAYDHKDAGGVKLPHKLVVRWGDKVYATMTIKSYTLGKK